MIRLNIAAVFFFLFLVARGTLQAGEASQAYPDSIGGEKLPSGSLVIAGGGMEPDNASVYNRLIELAGGKENASFAVIPTAGGTPVQSFVLFRNTLISYGVKAENIHLVQIAVVDDDSTTKVDESTWKNNGDDLSVAKQVSNCSCVWFTGGDQLRTTSALYHADGSRTPVLEAVWQVFLKGGVIGGTSAGAAIMSDPMIGGGNSMAALAKGVVTVIPQEDFEEGNGVLITRGLGFFSPGMVDQHFEVRARIGRLIMAMLHTNVNLGFGIDENTALIYVGKTRKLEIAGASGVTMINTSQAQIEYHQNMPMIRQVLVSYLENGDSYNLLSQKVIPASGKKSVAGHENYNVADPLQTGMLSPSATDFKTLITQFLADNKGAEKIENLNFTGKEQGFVVTLQKTLAIECFYTDKPDGEDHYTVNGVTLDITPVKINYSPIR